MITKKPKSFSLVYDSGVRGENCDPITGKPWHRLSWRTVKASMGQLAKSGGEPLTLVNHDNSDTITVSPEGRWS